MGTPYESMTGSQRVNLIYIWLCLPSRITSSEVIKKDTKVLVHLQTLCVLQETPSLGSYGLSLGIPLVFKL